MPDLTGLPALDLLIGLSFIFLLLSLLCSAIQEAIAGIFNLRAKNLEKGLRNMLDGSASKSCVPDAVAPKIWEHPLIRSLFKGNRKPSYIPSRAFALSLLDTINPDAAKPTITAATQQGAPPTITPKSSQDVLALLRVSADANLREPAKGAVVKLIDEARGDIDRARHNLEDWFDDTMARVSGWYKRKAQIILCMIALIVTVALNVDTLIMGETLWKNDAVRSAVVDAATKPGGSGTTAPPTTADLDMTAKNVNDVEKLGIPMGWNDAARDPRNLEAQYWPAKLLGWFLTFAALSLGAPFWFDALSRLARLRNSGKPETPLPASGSGKPNERIQPPPDRPVAAQG